MKWRMMMMMMMMMMMLRRRTDLKTATYTVCEPAQSTCTWTCHKNCFLNEFTRTMPQAKTRDNRIARACAIELHLDISQEPLYPEFTGKFCRVQNRDTDFAQPVQSTYFLQNLQKEHRPQLEHHDQPLAFTPTIRTPQCGHTDFGAQPHTHKQTNKQTNKQTKPNQTKPKPNKTTQNKTKQKKTKKTQLTNEGTNELQNGRKRLSNTQ